MTDKDEKYVNSLLREFLVPVIDFFKTVKLNSLVKDHSDLEDLFDLCASAADDPRVIEKIKSAFLLKERKKKKNSLLDRKKKYESCLDQLKKAVRKNTKLSGPMGLTGTKDRQNKENKENKKEKKDKNSKKNVETQTEKTLLKKKLSVLGNTLGLNTEEMRLVKIALLTFVFDLDYIDGLSDCENLTRNIRYFSLLTGINKFTVSRSISRENILISSGLFYSVDKNSPLELFQVSEKMAKLLLDPAVKEKNLFETYFSFHSDRGLAMHYFAHLKNDLKLITGIIKSALRSRTEGVNVLLYGRPGTGKTEFAHSLAKHLGLAAVRVNGEKDRLSQYRLCLKVYGSSRDSCIIFDESDTVLSTCRTYNDREDENYRDKAALIDLLEKNPVPTVWIVNSTYDMHRAVKRRFSYSINFKKLPPDVTGKIIGEKIKTGNLPERLLNPDVKEYIIKNDFSMGQLSLALDRTKDVVKRYENKPRKAAGAFKSILNSMGKLDGLKKGASQGYHDRMNAYSLDFINTDSEPEKLINRIGGYYEKRGEKEHFFSIKNLNLLFYGPPGAGKTELVRHIAFKMGKPLIIKKSSDLLDMYIGNTEKNISRAFEEAEETGSILVLDEADSFFQKRSGAVRSWEISQVNEILNAMEQFKGVLICTTNFIDNFDKASLRRFAYKVKFNYLSAEQRYISFESVFGKVVSSGQTGGTAGTDGADGKEGIDGIEGIEKIKEKLESINKLTIGDFKTVYQQVLYEPEVKTGDIITLLAKESLLKEKGERKTVGFRKAPV